MRGSAPEITSVIDQKPTKTRIQVAERNRKVFDQRLIGNTQKQGETGRFKRRRSLLASLLLANTAQRRKGNDNTAKREKGRERG